MRKFLSLVLALVMVMSLVTISAGAKEFNDKDSISYDEAVDVISALSIVDGYAGNTFGPTNVLTRQAAAKIICNLILGPTTARALVADAAPFPDVPTSSEFAGYIAYCAARGIIGGYADGTFRPSGSLTGYAFMKMLLGALGYDATIEGFGGANWSINVGKLALGLGLDDGADSFDGLKTVNREEAALYAFNTLQATMVQYGTKISVTDANGSTVSISNQEAQKRGNSYNNDYRTASSTQDQYLQFCEEYFPDLQLRNSGSNKTDDFGRPANTWYLKSTEIGSYSKTPDLTYTKDVAVKDLYADLDLAKPYNFDVVIDGWAAGPLNVRKSGTTATNKIDKDLGGLKLIGNGSLIEVFKNDDGTDGGTITVINTYLYQVAGDYDEDDEELKLSEVEDTRTFVATSTNLNLKNDDFGYLSDFKDEDYVLVTGAYDTSGNFVVKTVAPAEKVTGAVSEYVQSDDRLSGDSVTLDGESYNYAWAYDDPSTNPYELKEEYDLYLDPYGYVLHADGIEGSGNYVFIDEFYSAGNGSRTDMKAYAIFPDGTEGEITIKKIDGVTVRGGDATTYDGTHSDFWYRYSDKGDGAYDIKGLGSGSVHYTTVGGDVTNYDDQHAVVDLNGGGVTGGEIFANKDTVFVIIDKDDDVSVYTGVKNVPDTYADSTPAHAAKTAAYSENGYAKVVLIDVGGNGTVKGGNKSGDTIFFYKLNNSATDSDGDDYYIYKAIVNGVDTTIRVDESAGGVNVGFLSVDVEYNTKGWVSDADFIYADGTHNVNIIPHPDDYTFQGSTADDGASSTDGITEVTGRGQVVVIDGYSYYMADSYKIFVIEKTDVYSRTISALRSRGVLAGSTVTGVINNDGEYSALYIYHS